MAQHLDPTWGVAAATNVIARTAGARHGMVINPIVSFGGNSGARTLIFSPGTDPSFWAWRTFWEAANGSHVVLEDASKTLALGADPSAGNSVKILIIGRWKFAAGITGSDGKPSAPYALAATYDVVLGTPGATPSDPSWDQPDTSGYYGVILGRVILTNGAAPAFQWLAQTMLDPGKIGQDLEAVQAWIDAPVFGVSGFSITDVVTSTVYQFQMISGVLTQVAP